MIEVIGETINANLPRSVLTNDVEQEIETILQLEID